MQVTRELCGRRRSKMLQKERGTLECYPRKPALAKLTVFTLVGLVLRDELMSK